MYNGGIINILEFLKIFKKAYLIIKKLFKHKKSKIA